MRPITAGLLWAMCFTAPLGVIFYYAQHNSLNCEDQYDQMAAVFHCIEGNACMVTADDLLRGKRASRYYSEHCDEYDSTRKEPVLKPTEGDDEADNTTKFYDILSKI